MREIEMSQATLQRILSEVETLSSEEKVTLVEALKGEPDDRDEQARIHSFHQAMLASGMVTEIKPRRLRNRPLQLIDVPGLPVSESLVEERR
jgi:hypothetical protein